MELKTIMSNGVETTISVPTSKEMGKLLLEAKPRKSIKFGHGLGMEELDTWTDKNLTVEERRFAYFNKQQRFTSDSDRAFTLTNLTTIIGWFIAWCCASSILAKMVFAVNGTTGEVLSVFGLGFTGFMVTVYLLLEVITHPKQVIDINTDHLSYYLIMVLTVGLLFSFLNIDWFIGMYIAHYVYTKLCVCPNYYTRKKVYL